MAKFKQGILGPISGKIGPVIGASWKGISYLRLVPIKKSTPRVPTAAQVAHHQKFSFLTKWLKPLHPYISVGFRSFAKHNTALNMAFSYNFKLVIKGDAPNYEIDHPAFCLSRGTLQGMDNISLQLLTPNTLQLNWINNYNDNCMYSDQLMLVLYNDEIGFTDGFTGGAKRSAKTCTYTFEPQLVDQPFHVYAAMVSVNGNDVSCSQYLGKIESI